VGCDSVARDVFLQRRWLPARGFAVLGLVVILAWLPSVSGAVEIPPLRSGQPPDFTADLVLSLDGEGRPALAVSVAISYVGMQWVRLEDRRSAGRYGAAAEIAVAFEPRKGGRLFGDVWERRIVVESFDDTRAPRAMLVERRSFDIPPGAYDVAVTVRDLNAGTESKAREPLHVPDYSRVPVGFADLELGRADSTSEFRSVPTRIYGLDAKNLAARASMFDRRPGSWPRQHVFRYRVLDEVGQKVVEGSADVTLSRSAEPVVIGPIGTELFVGHYVFEVELVENRSRWRVDRSFEVEESGPPRGQEFERILEPLSYVATADEIESLRELTVENRARGWEQFWRRRDPTPDTPRNEALIEFVRRVRHAERHFQGYGPGWRSDMGRIYIRYGPPDQVETRAATTEAPQLEIWYYNNPFRRFVFGDREGFGRFVLLSPVGE
jgi:GWxTD domain-containing protein